jgi:hypothetical protein|nr:MAG TPA: hypothetical protein [Caudoviricetes sp.]
MSKFSRDKGKRGEREVALILREHGFEARRGQQYCGANGDADVVGVPGLHIEVKRTEKFRMYEALDQAINDAREDELPVVFTRKNNCDWVACLRLDDFMELFKETF